MGGQYRKGMGSPIRPDHELGEDEPWISVEESCCDSGARVAALRIYAKLLDEDPEDCSSETLIERQEISAQIIEIIDQKIDWEEMK